MILGVHRWWMVAGVLILLSLVVLYAVVDPATAPFPRCPFLLATGLKCPGCGSQRAVHALLHADIISAWRYNALLLVSIPVVALMCWAQLLRKRRPKLYNRVNSQGVIVTVFIVIVVWWIARNIWNF